jgi:hypothetical protein
MRLNWLGVVKRWGERHGTIESRLVQSDERDEAWIDVCEEVVVVWVRILPHGFDWFGSQLQDFFTAAGGVYEDVGTR